MKKIVDPPAPKLCLYRRISAKARKCRIAASADAAVFCSAREQGAHVQRNKGYADALSPAPDVPSAPLLGFQHHGMDSRLKGGNDEGMKGVRLIADVGD